MLSADDARLLDGLSLGPGSSSTTPSPSGRRRARARGRGVEFHEYRHYEPGDDPRSIDWTVEARLDQLVVRVARAEGELRLHLLLDTSLSMSVGTPNKLACAGRIAAALSYVAVERRDLVGLTTFDSAVRVCLPPAAGRGQLFRTLGVLQALRAESSSSIDDALLHYGAAVRGPGMAVVISDFFEPGAGVQGLRYLLHRGLAVAAVQVVADDDLAPQFDTSVELIDVEHPGARLVVSPSLITEYRRRVRQHCDELRAFCAAQGLPWLQVNSSSPFKSVVNDLKQAGILVGAV